MNIYHFSRTSSFEINQKIELIKPYGATNKNSIFLDQFQSGLSQHGIRYINQVLYPNTENSFNFSNQLLEYEFELVRRIYFPSSPSRFTSLFALKSLEHINDWTPHLTKNYRVYELNVDIEPEEYDASFLCSFPSINKVNNELYQAFDPLVNFDNAYQYWDKQISDTPQFELLIDLNKTNVTVIKEIII